MLLFSFSIFSDPRSLKIENENNDMKTLTAEAPYIGLESLEFGLYILKLTLPGELELLLTGTNFHGPKPARAIAVLLYSVGISNFIYDYLRTEQNKDNYSIFQNCSVFAENFSCASHFSHFRLPSLWTKLCDPWHNLYSPTDIYSAKVIQVQAQKQMKISCAIIILFRISVGVGLQLFNVYN